MFSIKSLANALLSLLTGASFRLHVGPVGEFEFGGVPALNELMSYGVQRPDAIEAVRNTLYDFLLYPTAGLLQFLFFQLPQGQGLSTAQGNAGNPKTLADTNMEAAGQLPSPKAFLATSIEIIFFAGSVATANTYTPQVLSTFIAVPVAGTVPISTGALNDINVVTQGGFVNMFISSKSYVTEAMVQTFPPKTGLQVDSSVSTNSATTGAIGIASAHVSGRPYYLNPPVLLTPNTNFSVSVNYPALVATPSGFNGRIGCRVDGFLYRNAQ
jgi:hypothetical protein